MHFSDDGEHTPDRHIRLFYVSRNVRMLDLLFQGQSNYSSILLRVIAIMSQSGWPYLIIISTLYVIYLTSMLRILTFALTHVI